MWILTGLRQTDAVVCSKCDTSMKAVVIIPPFYELLTVLAVLAVIAALQLLVLEVNSL